MKDCDDLSWYSRKADGLRAKTSDGAVAAADDVGRRARIDALLARLSALGIRGSVEHRTMFTRSLPPGCRGCLGGKGTNLYVTGLCTRDCFFCFNTKPRKDEIVVHGFKIKEPEEAAQIVERYGLHSVGISGGEPLLFPERVLRIIRSLRSLKNRVRIDLYSNGDRATDDMLARLKEEGLDAVRFNLVANEFDISPVRRALRHFKEVAVEIPAVPDRLDDLKGMVLELDRAGAPYLNIHELFSCRENDARVRDEGYAAQKEASEALLWSPVADGEEAALSLLLFALENAKTLSAYYCSCKTQEMISRRGLKRRNRLLAS